MVMPRAANVHDVITGGQDTIAIRVPAHPMAAAVAHRVRRRHRRTLRQPLRAPVPDPCRARARGVGEAARVILDGGECQIGLESTIVSFEGGGVRLLRPGSVTAAQLRQVVGELVSGADSVSRECPAARRRTTRPARP